MSLRLHGCRDTEFSAALGSWLGRFVLEQMLVPEELVLASRRLRARAPHGPSTELSAAPRRD
ncbi:hypothetical protein [Streptomyces sp. CG 926]|uniref:hypothetical protein n=1 Tax=Streptomyces sp. CG 926 TaxID=1882405 RepID=UPI000D6C36B7|nr:hypothetical protein [Streptomyces sp. CG 926]